MARLVQEDIYQKRDLTSPISPHPSDQSLARFLSSMPKFSLYPTSQYSQPPCLIRRQATPGREGGGECPHQSCVVMADKSSGKNQFDVSFYPPLHPLLSPFLPDRQGRDRPAHERPRLLLLLLLLLLLQSIDEHDDADRHWIRKSTHLGPTDGGVCDLETKRVIRRCRGLSCVMLSSRLGRAR